MSYKSLNIDRNKIQGLLETYQSEVKVAGPKQKAGNQFEYSIVMDEKPALVQFYFNNDGTTTIHYKLGKHPELSEQIAAYIKEHAVIDNRKNFSLSFRGIKADQFELLLQYLNEEAGAVVEEDKTENSYRLVKVKGVFKDILTFKLYSNGTLQIQGKPVHLYLETTCFLSEFLDLGQIIEAQSKVFDIDIKCSDISEELAGFLPLSIKYLDDVHVKVLSSALVLGKINVPLQDYSPFAFPALRALEGYVKKLLLDKGIPVDHSGFGFLFTTNATGSSYILKEEFRNRISCANTSDAIQRSYSYLNAHRHSLFHMDSVSATTRILENKSDAESIVANVLLIIEDTYSKIKTLP